MTIPSHLGARHCVTRSARRPESLSRHSGAPPSVADEDRRHRALAGTELCRARPAPSGLWQPASQLPQRDLVDAVTFTLLEDEVGALAGGENVLVQIDQV